MQPFYLSGLASDDHVVIPLPVVGLQVGRDHVEILVETRLRDHVPIDDHPVGKSGSAIEFNDMERVNELLKSRGIDVELVGRSKI